MKGFLSRISKNPERRFKRNVRYRKTGRTRQAAGAGKHPPEAAARHIWTERYVYAAVRGADAGGGHGRRAGATGSMGRVRRDAAAGGRGRLCAGGRALLRRGGGDHRAVLPAQKQRNPEKRRGGQARPTRTGGEKPMKKRILSILLLCCMVLTLLPTAAFAEGSTEELPVCTCETACMAESMNDDCSVCGAEGASAENCAKYADSVNGEGSGTGTSRQALTNVAITFPTPEAGKPVGDGSAVSANADSGLTLYLFGPALWKQGEEPDKLDENAAYAEGNTYLLNFTFYTQKPITDETVLTYNGKPITRYADYQALTEALDAYDGKQDAYLGCVLFSAEGTGDPAMEDLKDLYLLSLYAFVRVPEAQIPEDTVDEQFTLTPGGRYYFDLSAMNIPGTVNGNLPDSTLRYVPFTYAGTVNAYKLTSETATTEEYAQQNKYLHSLFIADFAVTNDVSWDALNTADLIFSKNYASGGVDYTLRTPSAGSDCTGLDDSQRGVPQSNEWDTMLNKDSGYIQNWNRMFSWGQDVSSGGASYRAVRGYSSARFWGDKLAAKSFPYVGFRPVLEVLNADTLGSDGLKAVTLDLNGGTLGGSSDAIQIIVKTGSEFTAPASDGMTRPDGNTGSYFMWLGSNGKLYAPGDSVPADVTKLTAQWRDIAVPTGEIKIAENGWKSFFNTITFGLFFKDAQTVTVTAADNSGETVTIEYLLSEKALAESELAGMTFTAYSAPFSINPDNKYVIYAKLTDTSGNVAYINTNGIVLDATVPGISGIADGKTYCAAQIVTVDEKYIGTVKVNGTEVSLDENSQFALSPASGEQTIVVTDKAGNETKVTVTVNDGHTYEWQSENGQYWQKCKFCNHETAKKDIPTINISGADKVCRTQDYKFSFTLPEGATDAACGYEFIGLGGAPLTPTVENGLYSGIIKASTYPAKENIFKLIVSVKTADGFAFSAEKKVTIQNEHTGGTATCKDKAKCGVCGESYGKLDPNNHANLKHIDAKAATKTSEGNIEYWYCDGCNKYYKDAKATQEITKAQTVTAKLSDDSKSQQTGDNSNLALWIALLFISGGAVTVTTVYGRKKKRLTK